MEWILGHRDGMWMSFLTRSVLENATRYPSTFMEVSNDNVNFFIIEGNNTYSCFNMMAILNEVEWEVRAV